MPQESLGRSDGQPSTATTGGPWPSPSLPFPSLDDSAENRRYIRSDGPPPDSQASASFHESWLQDPLHLLGGGSAVAAGQAISDSSGWATQLEETPRFLDNEDFEPSIGDAKETDSAIKVVFIEREDLHNNEDYGPAPLEEPNWTEFGVSGAGQVYDLGPVHNGDTFAEDAPVLTRTQGRREGEWTESEAYMAEDLLFAIHDDD
ncbi:hypothetical protein B0T16DRAFT_498843 [Cercophora newfieldiana]|uniref:Uncharacterized protein n=1 Tax=Cercophora newfieldiana TaxID=92897 RepID=A0AA39YQ75_9PEZI|nr:hypothetical protein B0T16DRAFT_498843 [Cercophora newfieldiana]